MKYKNTKANRVLEKHGEEHIKKLWQQYGYQKTADHLNTTKSVIRSIVKKMDWKRPAIHAPNILKGVINGQISADDYPHLDFENIQNSNDKNVFYRTGNNQGLEISMLQKPIKNTIENSDFIIEIIFNPSHTK